MAVEMRVIIMELSEQRISRENLLQMGRQKDLLEQHGGLSSHPHRMSFEQRFPFFPFFFFYKISFFQKIYLKVFD